MTWCIFVHRLACSYIEVQRTDFQWSNYTYLHFYTQTYKHCRNHVSQKQERIHFNECLRYTFYRTIHNKTWSMQQSFSETIYIYTILCQKIKTRRCWLKMAVFYKKFQWIARIWGKSATFAILASLKRTYSLTLNAHKQPIYIEMGKTHYRSYQSKIYIQSRLLVFVCVILFLLLSTSVWC